MANCDSHRTIQVAVPCIGEEEVIAVREVLLSGNYISGVRVEEFEHRFADYIGTDYAVACNSGTAAIHLALACYGIGPGDEVIVPAMTFFSTATAVLHQNAIPVFADIDENYCIAPESFKRTITHRTKAIIPVHLFGYAAAMDEISAIARSNNILVIEDCAQAHGTEYYGKKVGSIGDAGCFSFFATKNMTTGEGGMITTNNLDVANRAKQIRSHGMSGRDDHCILGYNYRMTEMEAAIGLIQLSKLDAMNQKRIDNSLYLLNRLRDMPWLRIQEFDPHIRHTFFWCPVFFDEEVAKKDIEDFKSYLKHNGIEFRHRYREPLYKQKMLNEDACYPKGCPLECPHAHKRYDYKNLFLPNVERCAGKLIGLPNHPGLTPRDLETIIDVLTRYHGGL